MFLWEDLLFKESARTRLCILEANTAMMVALKLATCQAGFGKMRVVLA